MSSIFRHALKFLVLLACLGGCATSQPNNLYPPQLGDPANVMIDFVAYDEHTGVIVDRHVAAPWLSAFTGEFEGARYLEFGWGDLDWYLTDEKTVGMGLKALFSTTKSGLWVWAVPMEPGELFSKNIITRFTLTQQGFVNLVLFINNSFALDQKNRPQLLKKGTFRKGEYRIYLAKGDYHAFRNCNHWTAEALHQAGFETGFFDHYSGDTFLGTVKSAQQNLGIHPLSTINHEP